MDAFVKQFFPAFDAPGAEFVYGADGSIHTYYEGYLSVYDEQVTQNRRIRASQPMTPYGLTRADMRGGPSSLDGLNTKVLTPEGAVNVMAIHDMLKVTGGMSAQLLSAHIGAIGKWSWSDNHVSLIVNMLRYVLLKRMREERGNLNGRLGLYDDGHVQVNMDQWWPADYPEVAAFNSWPTDDNRDNYPLPARLTDNYPQQDLPTISLRGLTDAEATFVVMMMGRWDRSTRCRLDFSTPRLADDVLYRSDMALLGISTWLEDEAGHPQAQRPVAPSSSVAWSALRAYVTNNRVYEHFSTALYLVCALMYQFSPATAEATWWLSQEWYVTLPRFQSVRGRYESLLYEIPALISHRSLREWGYISGKLEKIHLIALTLAQAAQTGMAVRATRRGIEDSTKDLDNTLIDYQQVQNFYSLSVSEATRTPTPMPGMVGTYLFVNVRPDDYFPDRLVTTENVGDNIPHGYEGEIIDEAGMRAEDVVMPPDDPRIPEAEREGIRKQIEEIKAAATAALTANPLIQLTPAQIAAVTNRTLYRIQAPVMIRRLRIAVPWLPFAGVPTLIMPINPFSYNTPFSLKGVIDEHMGEVGRIGYKMKVEKAWEMANLLRMCGYDMTFTAAGNLAGPNSFSAPNNAQMVWPITWMHGEQLNDILVHQQRERANHFILLPHLVNRFIRNRKITYKTNIQYRGVAASHVMDRRIIEEFGPPVNLTLSANVTWDVPEGTRRMRGYVTRTEQDFQFAETVKGGEIPIVSTLASVTIADAPSTSGIDKS
nr:MAG: capsid protein [Totivirus monocotyledonae 2]